MSLVYFTGFPFHLWNFAVSTVCLLYDIACKLDAEETEYHSSKFYHSRTTTMSVTCINTWFPEIINFILLHYKST